MSKEPIVIIANFYGCKKHDSGRIQHDTERPREDLFSLAEEAFDLGLNVMIKHLGTGNVVLYYSTRGFGQK